MNQLEKRVQTANLIYRKKKIAIIGKVEVPILVTKTGMIPRQSTVDFTGIYKKEIRAADQIDNNGTYYVTTVGQGIAFDAKETLSKTSFPLSNIHQHQLVFLEYFEDCGGTSFFLIQFKKLHPNHAFVTPLAFVKKFWYDESSRRSLPYTDFDQKWLTEINNYLKYFINDL
jgi:recombination protein U